MYLDKLQDDSFSSHSTSISVSILLWTLGQLHFSCKSVSIWALERNDLECSIYMNWFAEIVLDSAIVMFIDKAAQNKKNPSHKMGWSLRGRQCVQQRCFVQGQHFFILPVFTLNGIIAHDIIPGEITSDLLVIFLCEHVTWCLFVPIFLCYYTLWDFTHKLISWPSKCSHTR